MIEWIEGIQNAIEYMEDHLTEELDIRDIAEKAYISPFYFQRIFGVLCGFSVGEYIRNRRLSMAAEELSSTDAKMLLLNTVTILPTALPEHSQGSTGFLLRLQKQRVQV
jgi:AraC-like DNA-binding protein